MSISMFTVGFVIFSAYLYFLIWNINNGHKPKDVPNMDHHKTDVVDMDGMGDFSRFPSKETQMKEFGIKKIYRGVSQRKKTMAD